VQAGARTSSLSVFGAAAALFAPDSATGAGTRITSWRLAKASALRRLMPVASMLLMLSRATPEAALAQMRGHSSGSMTYAFRTGLSM
jgi:hypothetical protein